MRHSLDSLINRYFALILTKPPTHDKLEVFEQLLTRFNAEELSKGEK